MSKKITFLICLYCLCPGLFNVSATHTITIDRNMYRAKDIIVKQQIEYIDPGLSGANILWDFSKTSTINDKYTLSYHANDTSKSNRISSFEHGTHYIYTIEKDTLWLLEYNNRNVFMNYQKPEMIMRFPLNYGDTLSSSFSGKGKYCQTIDLFAEGIISIFADAFGKIITSENDTIHNILRVNRKKEYLNVGTDSNRIVLQSHQWYRRGERYPVYETIKSTTYSGDSLTIDFSASFFFSEICRENLPFDPENQVIEQETSVPEILNCEIHPNPVRTQLKIKYELSQKASVSYVISDMKGKIWLLNSTCKCN